MNIETVISQNNFFHLWIFLRKAKDFCKTRDQIHHVISRSSDFACHWHQSLPWFIMNYIHQILTLPTLTTLHDYRNGIHLKVGFNSDGIDKLSQTAGKIKGSQRCVFWIIWQDDNTTKSLFRHPFLSTYWETFKYKLGNNVKFEIENIFSKAP